MKRRLIFLVILLSAGSSTEPVFIGEVLHYSAGFRLFSAGHATLSMVSDSLDGEMVYLLTSTVTTNSFLSNFYKVRDVVQSWLSTDNLSLKKIVKTIREGRYQLDHEARILGDSLAISVQSSIKLPGKVYDPVSYVYFLRMQTLLVGNRYHFYSYGETSMKEVSVNVTGIETIKVPAGTFRCFKIEPISRDGKPLLKNNGAMRVWLSEDKLHLPIKIEQNTNIGTMVMKLKEISQL